ncbi:MAG: NAD(+) synthase [Clostridium sp.]|jgi:NAD+ synthase (glutamine-hydrolysing)|nr:NAD(+) synthase [Clostridium sp.]
MRDGFLKVAALTPKIKVADPSYNAQRICELITSAREQGAKVIVFPELCITGYTCGDLFLQRALLEQAIAQLRVIAKHTSGHDALVFVGLPIEHNNRLYNCAAVVQDGRILGLVPKSNLPTYAEYYEGRHFTPGERSVETYQMDDESIPFGGSLLFECTNFPGLKIACELCEDVWVADPPSTRHALMGATIIVNLSASNETVAKSPYRQSLICATSARLLCAYVYACAGEGESTQDLVFGAHNLIAENGALLAEGKRFCNETIYADVDLHRLGHERRRMGTFGRVSDATDASYVTIPFKLEIRETRLERFFDPAPFVPGDVATRKHRCEEILSIQSYGLKKRLEHTGLQTAILGISGGLDSTLALFVTARAFALLERPMDQIIAVTMPCFGTTGRTLANAKNLVCALGATLLEIPLHEAVSIHLRDLDHDPGLHDITYENAQARERTQVLMDLANQYNGLVIGTGDMSELALGWATYNGDHMSMYGVNAGVPKTLVRHLVDYIRETCAREELAAVLGDVLDTPVSPELLPPVGGQIAQKTEDTVGPYELHDFFLYYMLRCGFTPSKVYRIAKRAFAKEYSDEILLKWLKLFYRRFFAQQFKRSCLPDGPKVGSVALSPRGDLRMPSDASVAIWEAELSSMN